MKAIAHHDAEISSLSNRMSGIEDSMRVLQGEVHSGFHALGSKLDRMDAVPKFDFHRTVSTVTTLAVLFSMVVAGIIWVTTGQFGGLVEKQKLLNDQIEQRMTKIERLADELSDRVGWASRVRKPHE